jgi:hypothetical protein
MGSIEFIDLTNVDGKNRALLRAARQVFDTAYAVTTSVDGFPSQIFDMIGRPIAMGWFDQRGNVCFRTLSNEPLN